jgi:hypothetical protein
VILVSASSRKIALESRDDAQGVRKLAVMASESGVKRPIHHHVRFNAFALYADAFPAQVSRNRQYEPIVVAYLKRRARSQASWSLRAYDGGKSILLGKLSQHLRCAC